MSRKLLPQNRDQRAVQVVATPARSNDNLGLLSDLTESVDQSQPLKQQYPNLQAPAVDGNDDKRPSLKNKDGAAQADEAIVMGSLGTKIAHEASTSMTLHHGPLTPALERWLLEDSKDGPWTPVRAI